MIPTPVSGQGHHLTNWTPEKAETLIQFLRDYPETLPYWMLGYLSSGYHSAFQAAGLAELENAVRFPESAQTKTWQWDGAFHQYEAYNEDAPSLYADFIVDALNSNETDLANLKQWSAKKIALPLKMHEVTPLPGYQSSTVLHFYTGEKVDFTGGFAIWLVQEEGVFSAYTLPNRPIVAYGAGDSVVSVIDITGDGIAEAFVQNVERGSFGMHGGDLTIYRLDQVPPQIIEIDPQLPDPEIAQWSVSEGQAIPVITFNMPTATGTDTPCFSLRMDWYYQWKQDHLQFIQMVPPSAEDMKQDPLCTRILVDILGSRIEKPTILEIYKQLLNLPYIDVPLKEGDGHYMGYPFDVELHRLELAIYLSSRGDEAGAREQIELIRASTDPAQAEWRENALAYYAAHKDPHALYQFCLTSKACTSFMKRESIFALIPASQFTEAPEILRQMGIGFDSSGSYDFDHDGQAEIWMFYDDEFSCGAITILAQTASGIKSRGKQLDCSYEPGGVSYEKIIQEISIEPKEPIYGLPVYQVTVEGEEMLDDPLLYWSPDGEKPTVYPGEISEKIDLIQNRLLLGEISPLQAQDQIFAIQNQPVYPFYTSVWWVSEQQAHLLYLLGLSYELNGQSQQAVDTYLELWQNYPNSPYAYMAFSKLEPDN